MSKKKYGDPNGTANDIFEKHYEQTTDNDAAKAHSLITVRTILEREIISNSEKIRFYNEVIKHIKTL